MWLDIKVVAVLPAGKNSSILGTAVVLLAMLEEVFLYKNS